MANFDERSSQRISAVLSWIAFAKRPLRLAELLSALAFDSIQEQVDDLVPAYILDRCEPLIQKQTDSSYSFVHVSVRDFLQSSDTALLVTENESQRRHGLATVRCLLSGQQIFAPLYPDPERELRVLRGLHGFHMYATRFWVDYLLPFLESDQDQFFESDFFVLSCRLAENFIAAETDCEAADSSLSDPRLALIRKKDYRLYEMIKVVLLEQNKEIIEVVSIHDDTTCIQHDDTASDVIALKKDYQTMIQKLLNYSNYPGISFQQLEQFKQNFRTSAFTCRVWSCPYATLGFNNIDSLTRHEAEHSKHICRVQGCQYPVFASARLLKNHVAEQHTSPDQQLKRNSIRKRPTLVSSPSPDDVPHEIEALKEDSYRTRCICNSSESIGLMVECDTCSTWQHVKCFYPDNQREAIGDDFSHSCADCKPRPLDREKAIKRMQQLAEAKLESSPSPSPSPSPSLMTAASRGVFNQRISAANSQHLNTIRNSPSSSVSLDASPFHQGSSLSPSRLPNWASKPQMLDQEPNIPDDDPSSQHVEQLRQKISYPPPAQTNPYETQGNGLPLPIPPPLKFGDACPPNPTPNLSSGFPAADHRSTLSDSTSTHRPPHSDVPYGYFVSERNWPRLGPNGSVGRACDACIERNTSCNGISPCYNCYLAQFACTYNDISQNKPPGKN
ncbi:hypothetical protein HDV62DRAFT_402187 [Trichoderma sp. SZMC 28011]